MGKTPQISNAVAVPSISRHFFPAKLFVWPLVLTILFPFLPLTESWAAIVEHCSLRSIGKVVEIQFTMDGKSPTWHLVPHQQELWLNLEHSEVSASVELAAVPAIFPLTNVRMRDFGGGDVRLVIHVRGEVDYAVAQMPHVLVVRIAPSGAVADLGQRLFAQMEQSRSIRPASSAPKRSHHRASSPTVATFRRHVGTAVPAQARINPVPPNVHPPISPNEPASSISTSRNDLQSTHESIVQEVQPVAQHLTVDPRLPDAKTAPLIAIDAGHGGFDPGTESATGITEKSVALPIAQRLETALEARGFNAVLTRNDDTFLSLGERTSVANRMHADLFVSIHLNSNPNWNTSGIETYYLNNTTDRATIRLARMENGADYGTVEHSNLNYILTNLRQDYKAHDSSSLARMIEAEAAATIETSTGIKVNALGAKMGPFYVLVGAEMPSVLVECGFLSNPREAQLLIQPSYQAALADGIAMAITHYFNADTAVGNL